MFKKQSPVRLKNKVKGKPGRRIIDPNKRMLLRQLVIGFFLFSTLGLIIAGVWYGTRISALTISSVVVSGGETIDHSVVETAVQKSLEGTYMGIIPRRFSWWYPEVDIYTSLASIPRLKDPHVEQTSGSQLAVTFDEYVPYALWCVDRTATNCLFVDKSGYAFTAAPQLKGGALIRYRTLGATPKVGERVATVAQLATMEEFIRLVSTLLKFEVESVETDSANDAFYILAGGGELKVALRDQANTVFENLRAIKESKEFQHLQPDNFQYIDLRFGTKVFVNEEKVGQASSTKAAISSPVVLGTASTTR